MFLVVGCGDDELFDELDDPTPGVLRGVYQNSSTDGNSDIDLRLRFDTDVITGAAQCRPRNTAKFKPMDIEGEVAMVGANLDAAEGDFTIEALVMSQSQGDLYCEAGLRAGTYHYKVVDLQLTLTTKDVAFPLIYGKVGD